MDREGQTATAGAPLAEQLGRVGLWTRQLDIQPADQLRTTIVELEELGRRSLWTWEVFGREALTNAGLLLCATRQLVIGTGIANIWARAPIAMAAAQRTLAEAHPGRFVLGIGVSHAPIVDARGHRYERPLERMRAYLDAMDAAPWQGATAPGAAGAGAGRPRPPDAGAGRGAIGRRADLPRRAGGDRLGALDPGQRAAAGGRAGRADGAGPGRGAPGRPRVRRLLPDLRNYLRAWERAGFGPEELANGGSDRLVDAMVAWGGPDAIAERAQAHLDAGADHVCLNVLDADPNALPIGSWRVLAPALLGR